MGDVVRDLAKALHQELNLVKHPVQSGGKPIEIIIRAAQGHTRAKISIDNRLGRSSDGVDPPQKGAAEESSGGQRQNQEGQQRPSQGTKKCTANILFRRKIIPDDEVISIVKMDALD